MLDLACVVQSNVRMKLTPAVIAKAIKLPVLQWPGRCFEVACAVVGAGLVPEGRAVYGHWTGAVSPDAPVFGKRSTQAFQRHGWVVTPDGTVIDPTRWVFEAALPYIFEGKKEVECHDYQPEDDDPLCCVCSCGHVEEEHKRGMFRACLFCVWPYDEGGNYYRTAMRGPCPPFNPAKKVANPFTGAAAAAAEALISPAEGWSKMQLHWLANTAYDDLEPHAAAIYDGITTGMGHAASIPIDNLLRAQAQTSKPRVRPARPGTRRAK